MQAVNLNLEIYKGSTYKKSFSWKTGSSTETLLPVNITGCTFKMQVRQNQASQDVLAEFTSANSAIVITDAVNGTFELRIPAAQSSLFTFVEGLYDLEITMSDSTTVYRLIQGRFLAFPEITR